jgi:hypothetical protein
MFYLTACGISSSDALAAHMFFLKKYQTPSTVINIYDIQHKFVHNNKPFWINILHRENVSNTASMLTKR